MSIDISSNADSVETQKPSGNLDSMRDAIYNNAIDDRGGEPVPEGQEPEAQEAEGTTDTSGDPLARELTEEEREGYPDNVRTVSDVMKYARELNRYKGHAGNEIGELRKTVEALSQKMATPASGSEQPVTPEEYQAMIERGLATNPVHTIQELLERGIKRALDPILKEQMTFKEASAERERKDALDGFVAANKLEDQDLKEAMEIMQKRMPIYQGSPYFEGQPKKVLEDVWEIMQSRKGRDSAVIDEKRAKVISKGSGGIPRGDVKQKTPTREDVERAMGFVQ